MAENLPWSEKKEIDVNIGIPLGLGLLGGLFSKIAEIEALSSLVDLAHAPDEPVEVAYFKMCDCGGDHGRIYCRNCYTSMLMSKKHANICLNKLQAENFITVEEIEKLKKEIEDSKLPAE